MATNKRGMVKPAGAAPNAALIGKDGNPATNKKESKAKATPMGGDLGDRMGGKISVGGKSK